MLPDMDDATNQSTNASTDRPIDQLTNAVTIAEAAVQLGISQNAVRLRLRRGLIERVERPIAAGPILVVLPNDDQLRNQRSTKSKNASTNRPNDRATNAEINQGAGVQSMREQLRDTERDRDYWRREAERRTAEFVERTNELLQSLDAEREARKRADHLLAGMIERMPALAAGGEIDSAMDAPVAAKEAPRRAESAAARENAEPVGMSLWSRFHRWYRGEASERDA